MPTLFVALQCAQCSTMQVKQQKKSSNKWVCTVCNLRQSVCRIYARGPMASDLRKFVQEFNMSRMEMSLSDSTDLPLSPSDLPIEACQSKKRMDWSEYLDPVKETEDGKNKENELDVKIVTEMPLQKPKNTSSRYQQQTYENKSFPDNATKRKRGYEGYDSKYSSCSTGTSSNSCLESTKDFSTGIVARFQGSQCLSTYSGGNDAKTSKLSQRSRWSDYLDDENEEEIGDETVKGGSYNFMPFDAKQKHATEQLVEDEVHPDFV